MAQEGTVLFFPAVPRAAKHHANVCARFTCPSAYLTKHPRSQSHPRYALEKNQMSEKSVVKKPARPRTYTRRISSRFMDRREFAEMLGIHIETLKRLERRGKIPKPSRFGGILRYDRSVVEQFLKEAAPAK
jgi:predicted DNA-binding transcriptional regulator AlpA